MTREEKSALSRGQTTYRSSNMQTTHVIRSKDRFISVKSQAYVRPSFKTEQ